MAIEYIQHSGKCDYINEFPTDSLLRDAKIYEIGAGASEIRWTLIGHELFRDAED